MAEIGNEHYQSRHRPLPRIGDEMNSGYVLFKAERPSGHVYDLYAPEASKTLKSSSDRFAAWTVALGGGGERPSAASTVFFKIGEKYPGTNIRQLTYINEQEFERIRNSSYVARFKPYKDFEQAYRQAAEALSRP